MARITVSLPEKILFRTRIPVQIGDINYGNHLANDAVLRLCHEARLRWLATHGFSELDAGGSGLIMADTAIQYTAQSRHGDELEIELGTADIGRSGFTLLYHLRRPGDGQTIAKVQTGMVCFDYHRQKVSQIPAALQQVLEAV
ncbi:MAG: thioesterase family protein [Neisseria sp.]|nr:thioesterase family protein [Neisseria sp.]